MPHHPTSSSDPFDLLVTNVAALRAAGKLSTRSLAREAHISRSSVLNLENGHAKLSLHLLDKLARALDVKTGSLLGKRPVPRDEADGLIEVVLAHNLVAARKRLKLTQEQLSERSGIHRGVIAHIERRARNPSLQTLAKLAGALDLSIEGLLTK